MNNSNSKENNIAKRTSQDMQAIKSQLVDMLYWIFSIFMWFALAGSLIRSVDAGLNFNNYLQIALVVVFFIAFLIRNQLSYPTKTAILLITSFSISGGGLAAFGLQSEAIYFLVLFVILTSFLVNYKAGIYAFIGSIIYFLVIGFFHLNGILKFTPYNENFHNSITAWVMAVLIFSIISLAILLFWHKVYHFLIQKIDISYSHEENLNKINKLLNREIISRQQAEESLKNQYDASTKLNQEYLEINKELKKTNQELALSNQQLNEAKRKAQTADKLKSSFLSNMSHEIRTPLNAILGLSNLLTGDNFGSEDYRRYLNIIQESTHNLLDIISDIVTMAKLESKQYTLYPELIDVNNLIDELTEKFTREILLKKDGKVDLRVKKSISAPFNIIADEESFRVVFYKLIDNAIKFTAEGAIDIDISLSENSELIVKIKDTGIGMSPDTTKEIFNIFRQIEEDNTRKYGGIGLGLSITKGLLELLGGNINFFSTPGQGSLFTVSIPVLTPAESSPEVPDPILNRWRGKTIQIIGKQTWEHQDISNFLKRTSVILIYVEDAMHALDNLKEHPEIDLVIMSIALKHINSNELAGLIKKHAPQLPIIGYIPMESQMSSVPEEISNWDDFIHSPLEKNFLLNVFDKHLKKEN